MKPDYTKVVNDQLSISLNYFDKTPEEKECLLTFINSSDRSIMVNPTRQKQEQGWLGGFFASGQEDIKYSQASTNEADCLEIFLGYVQLVGYVVLNYKIEMDEKFTDNADGGNVWWHNNEYVSQYDSSLEYTNEERESVLLQVPFIRNGLESRMILGGNLGGIADLNVKDMEEKGGIFYKREGKNGINSNNRYLLQDMLYSFNSVKNPTSKETDKEDSEDPPVNMISLKDIMDAIIPFYSSSQLLLFSELKLEPNSKKTFRITFPVPNGICPSYNTGSSRPVCDQAWVSMKYSLIVGWSCMNEKGNIKQTNIYFPLQIHAQALKNHNQFFQMDYLQKTVVESDWKGRVIEESNNQHSEPTHFQGRKMNANSIDRAKFLKSLELIQTKGILIHSDESDVASDVFIDQHSDPSSSRLKPQLPQHLKTKYQINVNKREICNLLFSKPYYKVGEDIEFILEMDLKQEPFLRIVGLIAYVEAHEVFHVSSSSEKTKACTNKYKITPNLKLNLYANSWIGKCESTGMLQLGHGSINLPKFITPQFQASNFMDLKYFITFKFIMNNFADYNELQTSTYTSTTTMEEAISSIDIASSDRIDSSERQELDIPVSPLPRPFQRKELSMDEVNFWKNGSSGSEFIIKLPLYVIAY